MGRTIRLIARTPKPLGNFLLNELSFEAFGLAEPLMRAIRDRAYATPTPVQAAALPPQLANSDLLALAETGSGKTAAFVLPILQSFTAEPLNPNPREVASLVLAPTRELALQIDAEIAALSRHMGIRKAVVLGGVGKHPQISALKRGVHILVATPGRLLDLVSERHADLRSVRTLVLDEADRMFDMGFIRDIRKIVSLLPRKRRTALFSATMPDEIRALASELLTDPARVDLSPKQLVVDRIDQKVMMVPPGEKQSRLHTILADSALSRVIVFTRTKRGADRVAARLGMAGIGAGAIHGNKAQNARQRALADFAAGHVRVLVATDIAARGIDVSGVTHVINFDMPGEPETYVHRIGRTARKGESGIAISLCEHSERAEIAAIERLMKQKIAVIDDVGGVSLPAPPRSTHHSNGASQRRGTGNHGGRQADRTGQRSRGNRANRGAGQAQHNNSDRPTERASNQQAKPARGNAADSSARRDARPGRDANAQNASRHEGNWRGQPAHKQTDSQRKRHSNAHAEGSRSEAEPRRDHGRRDRGKDASWNGQQPPKFLRQRGGGAKGFAPPTGKSAD